MTGGHSDHGLFSLGGNHLPAGVHKQGWTFCTQLINSKVIIPFWIKILLEYIDRPALEVGVIGLSIKLKWGKEKRKMGTSKIVFSFHAILAKKIAF